MPITECTELEWEGLLRSPLADTMLSMYQMGKRNLIVKHDGMAIILVVLDDDRKIAAMETALLESEGE